MFDPSLMVQQGPNPGERFAQAFQQGQVTRDQNMAKAALAALVQDPNNAKALAALASVDPQAAAQFKQQQIETAKAHVGEHYANILKGAQIIRQVNPHDDASWQQALAVAQQAGIDISQVPPHYDAQYANGLTSLADAFAPQPNGQIVPTAPGGGVARMNPQTHQLEALAMPNDGSHPAFSSVGNLPQVHDQASYDAVPPGGQYTTPDGHTRVKQGGQSPQGSGGFR